jgi:hypothetical protein
MEISTMPYIKVPGVREKHALVIQVSVDEVYLGEMFVCSGSRKDLQDILDGNKTLRELF